MLQNQLFDRLCQGLNARQKQAAEAPDGPVMVTGAAGTGKTHVLIARIGHLLIHKGIGAGKIICFNATEETAAAFRRRLIRTVPEAREVNIFSFPGFCHEVIRENPSHFGTTGPELVSDLEQIGYLKKIIDDLPRHHLLKRYRGDVYFEVKHLRQLFTLMKREDLSPEFISRQVDSYLQATEHSARYIYQKNGNGFRKGDQKQGDLDLERERMERLRAGADLLPRYQERLRSGNRYDTDDLTGWVAKIFKDAPALLERYQEKYPHLLVDDFPDAGGAALRLPELLTQGLKNPSVFITVDEAVTTAPLTGGGPAGLLRFRERFAASLEAISLVENHRSVKPEGTSWATISGFEEERLEMIGIVSAIEALIASGVTPEKIGVLYRDEAYGGELLTFFLRRRLPAFTRRRIDLLAHPVIAKITLLMIWLDAEQQIPFSGDGILFEILHAEWFRVPALEIAALTAELSHKHTSARRPSLRQWLNEKVNHPAPDLFSSGPDPALAAAVRVLESLSARVTNETLESLCESIFREAGIVQEIMTRPGKHELLQLLSAFFDFIKEETRRQPSLGLHGLVEHFRLMKKEDLPLLFELRYGDPESVSLMTVQESKGLEFPYVFLAGLNARHWEKKKTGGGGFRFPPNLFTPELNSDNYERLLEEDDAVVRKPEEEELRRLFRIGVSRAEHRLFLSYSRLRNDGRESGPSMFLTETAERLVLPVMHTVIEPAVLAGYQALLLEGDRQPGIGILEKQFVNRLLESFQLSVSALNNYLRCPLEFYFKNLLRIPAPGNENMEFGSAVHFALEELFRKMQDAGNRFPPVERFTGFFDGYMHRHRGSFTAEQFDRRLNYGHIILPGYYNEYVGRWNPIVSIERNFRNVNLNGVPLKGRIDKLEFDGRKVNVVDYKTGNPDHAAERLKPPGEDDPNGGDYWRQAVFYQILLERYPQKDWEPVSTEFDFIEPDKQNRYHRIRFAVSPADIATVSQQIAGAWVNIQNHKFYTGCGKPGCHWCRFVRQNRLG